MKGEYFEVKLSSSSKDFLILFSGANTEKGKFNYYKSFDSWDINKIYLNCSNENYYHFGVLGLGDNLDETINTLKDIISERNNLYTFGCSMGGYGAILYGSILGADCIFSFGASSPFTSEYITDVDRNRHVSQWLNLKSFVENSDAKKFIFHGDTAFNDIASYFIYSSLKNSICKLYSNLTHAIVVPLSQKIRFDILCQGFILGTIKDLDFWFRAGADLNLNDIEYIDSVIYGKKINIEKLPNLHYSLKFDYFRKVNNDEGVSALFSILYENFHFRTVKVLSSRQLSYLNKALLLKIIQRNRSYIQFMDYSEQRDLLDIYLRLVNELNSIDMVNHIGNDCVEGYLDKVESTGVKGWCINKSLTTTDVIVNLGFLSYYSKADKYREDLKINNKNNGFCAFNQVINLESIDSFFNDGIVTVNAIESETKTKLIGSGKIVKSPWFVIYIERINSSEISGWAVDKNYPERVLEIEFRYGNNCDFVTLDRERDDLYSQGYLLKSGFRISLENLKGVSRFLSLYIKGTDVCMAENILIG